MNKTRLSETPRLPGPPGFAPSRHRERGGFALIVTLSLMIILVLLSVGLLSLATISLRSSGRDSDQATARANARLALQLAIGNLQRQLGPDQRINAPADLVSPEIEPSRAAWVGVWDSWSGASKSRPSPAFRSWLVSGDPENLAMPDFPQNPGKLVVLGNKNLPNPVSVPFQAIKKGGLAYWICDENAKARLGPAITPDSEELASHLERWQSAPAAGHRSLPGLADVDRDDERLARLFSTKTIGLLSTNPSAPDDSSYSAWSEGLLINVRDGGFREDLSLHLSNPDSSNPDIALYESSGAKRRGGINFRELAAYQNVWSRLTYGSSVSHPDGGPINTEAPSIVGSSDRIAATKDPYHVYARPVIISGSWHISVMTRLLSGTGAAAQYSLFIVLEPIITLWNPRDVNLVLQPGGHITVRCWGLPYDISVKTGTTNKNVHFNDIQGAGLTDNVAMEIGQGQPVVMRPGEVLIFSRGQSATSAEKFSSRFEGKLGWTGTGGFAVNTGIKVKASDPISIGMKPSTKRGAGSWGLIEFLEFVGTDKDNNSSINWTGGLAIDRSSWGENLAANAFPEGMFKDIPEVRFGSPTEILEDKKQPIALFSFRAKSGNQTSSASRSGRYLARLGPSAGGFDYQSVDENTLVSLPFEPLMEPLSGGLDRSFDVFHGKGFFGASYKADLGQSYIVTHSVPREPPISLGAFQHAHANGLKRWIFPGSGYYHDRILQPSVSHAIGNSFASPCIAPQLTEGSFNAMEAVDHSWLANDALWDRWFVSSVAARSAPHHASGQKGTARELFERFSVENGETKPLPNQHYRYAGYDPEADVEALFSGDKPTEDAFRKIASLLKIHGAFNVNSTDPAAWRSLFQSTSETRVPVESAISRKNRWENSSHPVAALLVPSGNAVKAGDLEDPSNPDLWLGFRDLHDSEIESLAVAMVEEVRLRGPFLSIADFVNRRVGEDPRLAAKGALQSALDKSANEALESGSNSIGGHGGNVAFTDAEQGSPMTHVPGHVKQGDILSSIGSRLTVRGDTFTIRAYGEAHDATGKVLASACCEAVVQRQPAWVDPADDFLVKPAVLTKQVNRDFGRRFSVLSFRWLSTDKV